MPTLAIIADIQNEGNLSGVAAEVLQPHLESAELEIRRLLTDVIYDEIEAEDSTIRKRECVKAEANLALSYAVHSINIETVGSGISSAKGFGDSRSELLSRGSINDLSERFRTIAMQFLTPHLPQPDFDNIEPGSDADDTINLGSSSMMVV